MGGTVSLAELNHTKINSPVFTIVLSASMIALLVVIDWALSFIPFVQLVTVLIVIIFFLFGYVRTIFIVACYVVVDCMISGGMWPIFISIPTMWLAWLSLPTLLLLSRLVHGSIWKKLLVVLPVVAVHGFIYGQTFAVVTSLIYNNSSLEVFYRGWLVWTLADIPWEIGQCVMGTVSTALLLPPVYKALERILPMPKREVHYVRDEDEPCSTEAKIYCPKCHMEIDDVDTECPYCGTKLERDV